MDLEEIALNASISVIIGLVVSFLFFRFLLKFYQPRIEIAVEAIRSKFSEDDAGEVENEIIKVKIRNLRNRPISGIRAEMHRLRFVDRQGGKITQTFGLPLVRSDPLGLAECGDPKKQDIYVFATRKKTPKGSGIVETMNKFPECELLFRILVTDGHSGIVKLFRKSYQWPRDFRKGEYAAGRSIEAAARVGPAILD